MACLTGFTTKVFAVVASKFAPVALSTITLAAVALPTPAFAPIKIALAPTLLAPAFTPIDILFAAPLAPVPVPIEIVFELAKKPAFEPKAIT